MRTDTGMQVRTTRFGRLETVEVPAEARIVFPEGLPGFEAHTLFALIEDARHVPLRWLQSLLDPDVRFVLVDPWLVLPEYVFELHEQDEAALELEPGETPEVYCILTVRGDLATATANVKAPLVLNRRRGRGRQMILMDEHYRLRQPLFADAARPVGVG